MAVDDGGGQTNGSGEPVGEKPTSSAPKMVPEGDVVGLKKMFQRQVKDLQSKLDDANEALLKEQAAREDLESRLKEVAPEDIAKLKADLEASTKSLEGLRKERLDLRRKELSTKLGVPEDSLKKKTVEQLDALDEAYNLIGNKAKAAQYDGGAGGPAPGAPLSSREKIKAGLVGRT